MISRLAPAGIVLVAIAPTAMAAAADAPSVAEKYLHQGQLAEGEAALAELVKKNPSDDRAKFELGTVQFFRGVENLGHSFYRYGLYSDRFGNLIPFLRLPVPTNSNPEQLTYEKSRDVLKQLVADLAKADATLATIKSDDVRMPLRLGGIRLDFTGHGERSTPLSELVAMYFGGPPVEGAAEMGELLVVFDRGDVAWLRGYCHLLSAFAEVALAYDGHQLFDSTAHIFFANVDTPYKFLTERAPAPIWEIEENVDIVDLIALVHLLRMPVKEPERTRAALGHLEQTLAMSRESWKSIMAEADDDHEWIPNAKQKNGALGVPVDQAMIDSWLELADEGEAILAGKRLIPLWRGGKPRGINLRRVFTEPRDFDVVLWVQGTAAAPYLEEGEMTKPEVWRRMMTVFRGNFVGFAIWFN